MSKFVYEYFSYVDGDPVEQLTDWLNENHPVKWQIISDDVRTIYLIAELAEV